MPKENISDNNILKSNLHGIEAEIGRNKLIKDQNLKNGMIDPEIDNKIIELENQLKETKGVN